MEGDDSSQQIPEVGIVETPMHFFYTYLHYLHCTSSIIIAIRFCDFSGFSPSFLSKEVTLPIPHLAGGKAMMLAEAFVSGGLINAALVHLSLGSVKQLEPVYILIYTYTYYIHILYF